MNLEYSLFGNAWAVGLTDLMSGSTRSITTDEEPDHTHSVHPPRRRTTKAGNEMPHVQLQYCEKDRRLASLRPPDLPRTPSRS